MIVLRSRQQASPVFGNLHNASQSPPALDQGPISLSLPFWYRSLRLHTVVLARETTDFMLQRIILTGVILVALAACGDQVVRVRGQTMSGSYNAGDFGYAAGGRDLRVVIVGNPFGGDQAAFERAVTDAMQGRNHGQETNFTTSPGPSARAEYRAVMVFNPSNNLVGGTVCQRDPTSLPTAAGEGTAVALVAVFCLSEQSLTQVRGDIDAAVGPDDPNFAELVGQSTQALFPSKRRKRRSRD